MPLRVAVLFSGGKDSTFAVWHCLQKRMDVKYLVTMEPKSKESYMFHYPNIRWTKLQAESMGIRQRVHQTSGEKEKEVKDLVAAIRPIRHDIDALAAGGLASNYQADRIGKAANGLGLKTIMPLWKIEPAKYWKMLLNAGFEVIIAGVSAEGLDEGWLGKIIDWHAFRELKTLSKKFRFHLGFEGGEAETFVTDCPVFRKKLIPLSAEKSWDGQTGSGFYMINDMMAIDKTESEKLMKEYSQKKEAIKKRLEEFRNVGSTSSEERLFAELAFCLCTPQSKAKLCWAAVSRLMKNGLLMEGDNKEIEQNLKGVRFHRSKARYIEGARKLLTKNGKLDVRGTLARGDMASSSAARSAVMNKEPREVRDWIVSNIKGLGYKESSHFLRNIGMGQGIAILDRHILKNLKKLGIIGEVPESLSPKKYLEIERRMSAFCEHIGISDEELDLLLWSKETGEIFK